MKEKIKSLLGNKKLIKGAGIVLSLVIIAFIVKEFIANWADIKPYLADMNAGLFCLSVLIYAAAFLSTGYNWSYLLYGMDQTMRKKDYLNTHMVTALARYIPGGIWNIVGKAAMCTKNGVEKRATTVSMILEYVFQIVSSGMFLIFFVPVLMGSSLALWMLILFFAAAIILLIFLPAIINLGVRILAKVFKEEKTPDRLSRRFVYICILRYVAVWLLTGLGLLVMMRAFSEVTIGQGLALVLSYPISWVVGFLSPSPNGMGIREAVLTLLLGSSYSYELLLLISLTSRIWTMLGEFVAFGAFQLWYRIGLWREK